MPVVALWHVLLTVWQCRAPQSWGGGGGDACCSTEACTVNCMDGSAETDIMCQESKVRSLGFVAAAV